MSPKLCPTGCGRKVRPRMFACRTCWWEIPRELRDEVYRTWAAWRADLGDVERLSAYRAAGDAALASIR